MCDATKVYVFREGLGKLPAQFASYISSAHLIYQVQNFEDTASILHQTSFRGWKWHRLGYRHAFILYFKQP